MAAVAGIAVVGANIEIGQLAVKQVRHNRTYRVAVIKNHVAVFLPNPFELFAQCIVVGLMVVALALLDFIGRWRLAVAIDRRTVEGRRRAQAGGVLSRIEGFIGRVTIGIDHVAVYRCTDDTGVGQQIGIQAADVPVGIGARLPFRVQPFEYGIRNLGAAMWLREHHRATAGYYDSDIMIRVSAAECCRRVPQ